MRPRRPTLSRLLQRSLLAVLLVVALLVQGLPVTRTLSTIPAAASAMLADDAQAPCHDMGQQSGAAPEAPVPGKGQADPFACCATFACGMMSQALPPGSASEAVAFSSAFALPAARLAPDLPPPDPAWRPPASFL